MLISYLRIFVASYLSSLVILMTLHLQNRVKNIFNLMTFAQASQEQSLLSTKSFLEKSSIETFKIL